MPLTNDLYGLPSDDRDALAAALADLLGIQWSIHYNSLVGDYHRAGPIGGESFKLQPNYLDGPDVWLEPEFRHFPTLLYVSLTERGEEVERRLIEADALGAVLLRRESAKRRPVYTSAAQIHALAGITMNIPPGDLPAPSPDHNLNRDSLPMRLFEQARRDGVWNPSDLDFSRDSEDWRRLADPERDLLSRLIAHVPAGEPGMVLNILPLIVAIARERRADDDLFLTTLLFDRARRIDFIWRFIDDVVEMDGDLRHLQSDQYRALVGDTLPQVMQRLWTDKSPEALIHAIAVYFFIVEGVLAETVYRALLTVLDREGVMPGVRRGIWLLKQDKQRHMSFAVYLVARLVSANPALWTVVETSINQKVMPAVSILTELFSQTVPSSVGLNPDELVGAAITRSQRRLARLQALRDASLETLVAALLEPIDADA